MGKWVETDVPPSWRNIRHPKWKEVIMPVSEDGVPYGSIDVNELDSVEPKTDEAKAALEGLKARIQEGQEQADKDAEAQAETAAAQDQTVDEAPKDQRDAQGKPEEAKSEGKPEKKQRSAGPFGQGEAK